MHAIQRCSRAKCKTTCSLGTSALAGVLCITSWASALPCGRPRSAWICSEAPHLVKHLVSSVIHRPLPGSRVCSGFESTRNWSESRSPAQFVTDGWSLRATLRAQILPKMARKHGQGSGSTIARRTKLVKIRRNHVSLCAHANFKKPSRLYVLLCVVCARCVCWSEVGYPW